MVPESRRSHGMIEGPCHFGAGSGRHEGRINHATLCDCAIRRRTGRIRGHRHTGAHAALAAPAGGPMI